MVLLDRTNLNLLDLLQKDARTSIIDLSRAVNRAESTVRERITALEREGILKGYRALVDPEKLGFHAQAILRADCDLRHVPDLAKRLEGIPQVTGAMLTTGAKPLVVHVMSENLPRLEQVLEKRMAPLELERIEAALVVHTLVEPRPISLGAVLMAPDASALAEQIGGLSYSDPATNGTPRSNPVHWETPGRPLPGKPLQPQG